MLTAVCAVMDLTAPTRTDNNTRPRLRLVSGGAE